MYVLKNISIRKITYHLNYFLKYFDGENHEREKLKPKRHKLKPKRHKLKPKRHKHKPKRLCKFLMSNTIFSTFTVNLNDFI